MKAESRSRAPVCASNSAGVPVASTLAGVHRYQPIELSGFLHVGGRYHHAHARPIRSDSINQLPKLAARQRIDAGRRLVENQEIRVVDQSAAQTELLLHAAGKLAGRPVGEALQADTFQQLEMRRLLSALL